jgi:hypothetical protein
LAVAASVASRASNVVPEALAGAPASLCEHVLRATALGHHTGLATSCLHTEPCAQVHASQHTEVSQRASTLSSMPQRLSQTQAFTNAGPVPHPRQNHLLAALSPKVQSAIASIDHPSRADRRLQPPSFDRPATLSLAATVDGSPVGKSADDDPGVRPASVRWSTDGVRHVDHCAGIHFQGHL